MKPALIIVACAFGIVLLHAWVNGMFLRCPHCRKIGSWRYDDPEPAVVEEDEGGGIESSRQIRVCRKCGQKVLDKWSDQEPFEVVAIPEGVRKAGCQIFSGETKPWWKIW
jgi:hypothetical protein